MLLAFGVLSAARAAEPSRLKVSQNRRFLVTADDKPFFYLGDTAWELFHRLDRQQAEKYLQNRASKRFTVIQAVVLAELDGLNDPNAYGDKPLVDLDPARPNEAYFKHVDWIVGKAGELGLYIGMLPTWGDKVNKKWGAGPEIFTPENARTYGRWLGQRYKERNNIIWIMGGDRPVENDRHRDVYTAMAEGIREGDGGSHLITFHPSGGQTSSKWFHDAKWLDFNMWQNGHSDTTPAADHIASDYQRMPTKPVMDGEPLYEDHPLGFKAKDFGYSVASDARRFAYWDTFAGACGHTYGNHSVWQMYDKNRKPVNGPLHPWYVAIDAPGAAQMQHARALLESRPYLTRIPDDSIVTSNRWAGAKRIVATRDSDGSYAMVYVPAGRAFTVKMDCIEGAHVRGWWYSPRNGQATKIGEFANPRAEKEFIPPDPGENLDWVLVLDDASKNFGVPGK